MLNKTAKKKLKTKMLRNLQRKKEGVKFLSTSENSIQKQRQKQKKRKKNKNDLLLYCSLHEIEMNKRPQGTRVLSAKEHRETLDILLNRKQELANQIEQMSVTLYTTRAQNQMRGFVKRMQEVDEALTVFERQKVYIKA